MKSQIFKISIFILSLLIFHNCQKEGSESFKLTGQKVKLTDPVISEVLSDYKAYVLVNFEEVKFADDFYLEIKLGNDYYWNVHLIRNNLTIYDSSARHYEGHLAGNQSNTIRMSFYDNIINGFIIDGDKNFIIQSAQDITRQSNKYQNVILVFEDKDVIKQDVKM